MNKQKMRFSDKDLEIIKSTFAEQEDMLITLRKLFLQSPLNKVDEKNLEVLKQKEVLQVIKKSFLPDIDAEAPIQQVIDLWMTVEIKDKPTVDAYLNICAREKLIEYLGQMIRFIENGKFPTIAFSNLTKITEDKEETIMNLMVRNTIITHTEMQLFQFTVLAGKKEETVYETRRRLEADSTR